jgi:hypothetical protein
MNYISLKDKLPPINVRVMTKIDDEMGIRNEQPLKLLGNYIWYISDSSHVYYAPTHWKFLTIKDEAKYGFSVENSKLMKWLKKEVK